MIKTKEVNAAGCYVVTLCVNGLWDEIVVDDYLPFNPDTEKVAFGSSKPTIEGRGVIWVSLIEKAWAKICSNYDRTIDGSLDMGFIHLCGVPSLNLKHLEFRS